LSRAAVVHLNSSVADISTGRCQAANSVLPANPLVVFGQPAALDPSRAPTGSSVGWIQLLDTPYRPQADAAGRIVVDGTWTPDVTERYADRVMQVLARHIDNLDAAVQARDLFPPSALEASNINFCFGDPYAGAMQLDQSMLYRPSPRGHRTPISALWHIGASTHPGPGLGAGSGWIVAQELTRRRRRMAGLSR
jgi:phytoene dehydrogenase-like protein